MPMQSTIAQKIKSALPEYLLDILRYSRNRFVKRHPPFRGIYQAYTDVPRVDAYNGAGWYQAILKTTQKCKAEIGKNIPESLSATKALLPVVASVLSQQKPALRILDFGGAAGLDFANIIAQGHNRLDLHYHVVDVPTACDAGRDVWCDPRISFSSEWPDGQFDIAYAYSAVHCVEDYEGVLLRMASYNPDVILLCKHPVYEGPTFARQQVNLGAGLELAQWALNLSEIEAILKKVGYILLYRGWGEDSDTYNVRNYPETHRAGRTTNLLFVRRNQA